MLSCDIWVARIDRFSEIISVTSDATTLLQQRINLCARLFARLGGCSSSCFHHAMFAVVSRQISHVLIAQAGSNTVHAAMFALAFLVGIERRDDELGILPGDHGHFVDIGKSRLITHNTMATNAHGNLALASFGIALHFPFSVLGTGCETGSKGHASDSKSGYRCQQLVHFSSTI